jgi:hypothetical protein
MSHPTVNDIASMRRLVAESLEAFGAWLVSSTPFEFETPEPAGSGTRAVDPARLVADLIEIESAHGKSGYGLASGLERLFSLGIDRLTKVATVDRRLRQYDSGEFWIGASEAVQTLLGMKVGDVYPEFIDKLGLEDDELDGIEIFARERGPADALARYVVNDWFAQVSDRELDAHASSTMDALNEAQNDQTFSAFGFKNSVIANMGIRWSFRREERWSASQLAGFGVVCDYTVRYIWADLEAPWSHNA